MWISFQLQMITDEKFWQREFLAHSIAWFEYSAVHNNCAIALPPSFGTWNWTFASEYWPESTVERSCHTSRVFFSSVTWKGLVCDLIRMTTIGSTQVSMEIRLKITQWCSVVCTSVMPYRRSFVRHKFDKTWNGLWSIKVTQFHPW